MTEKLTMEHLWITYRDGAIWLSSDTDKALDVDTAKILNCVFDGSNLDGGMLLAHGTRDYLEDVDARLKVVTK